MAKNQDLAASGPVHRRNQVQQSGFARAGWSHQCQEFSADNGDINFLQRDDVKLVANEFFGQLLRFDDSFSHSFKIAWSELSARPSSQPVD